MYHQLFLRVDVFLESKNKESGERVRREDALKLMKGAGRGMGLPRLGVRGSRTCVWAEVWLAPSSLKTHMFFNLTLIPSLNICKLGIITTSEKDWEY